MTSSECLIRYPPLVGCSNDIADMIFGSVGCVERILRLAHPLFVVSSVPFPHLSHDLFRFLIGIFAKLPRIRENAR